MKSSVKHLFAWLLALCMLFSAVPVVSAAETTQPRSAATSLDDDTQPTQAYADSDIVRVSIVLEAPPALEQYASSGASGKEIASNEDAQAYQETLLQYQKDVADAISNDVLDGDPLDVVWNLTLVSNTISANVPYGAIEAIRGVSGVSDVQIEPLITGIEKASTVSTAAPQAYNIYGSQTGTAKAYELGYKGAGMRIAILDTGINPNHQSFDGRAFAYALQQDYGDDYAKELNLLTVDEIRSKWDQLHVSEIAGFGADGADALYRSEKLPFNFNYPDHIPDATSSDSQAHGSHVAGIAAANRYLFLSPNDTTPVLAADQVLVQGVAPDAQLLALKIVGSNGGAYTSDQFVAIEDALVLGADAINLSIGTDWPGFSYNAEYQNVLDRLQETDTVVSIASGNYGSSIDRGSSNDLLSIEDVSMNTVCDPGSYTNAFTVASSDSTNRIGPYFTVNGTSHKFYFWGSTKGASFSALAGETAYPYIYVDSVGVVGDPETNGETILENQLESLSKLLEGGLSGKIVIMNRGTSTFAAKADAAVALGAIAVIIVNNEIAPVSADLQNYQHENIPVVTLNLEDREQLMEKAISGSFYANYDRQGNPAEQSHLTYYTGTLTVSTNYSAKEDPDATVQMSSLSAWGVPGSLELKPEITAPGGNIFSVDGNSVDGKGYTSLNGTSMATAQISGLAALVKQYAEQNQLKEKTGLTYRALAQSLLMSTAVPMKEADGKYYPILQQGAGLANAGNAITAPSYITVSDQPDGKVKVELKDDPNRIGRYTAVFTIHNLTNQALTYTVSADLFTQAIETLDGKNYLSTHTAPLQANVIVNGGNAPTMVSVPANGETTVTVTMALTNSQKAALDAGYPNGAYIQAFLNVVPTAADGVSHSIPVLGFYGNWTDPSMFDRGYCPSTSKAGIELTVHNQSQTDRLINFPYGETETYLEDRNAFDPSVDSLYYAKYVPLRNYSSGRCIIRNTETGEIYAQQDIEEGYGLYYLDDTSSWGASGSLAWLKWDGTDNSGNLLPEGTKFSVDLTLAPEYYRTGNGTEIDWDALGKGATMSTTVTIDRTAPEILDVETSTLANGYITVKAQDNRYVGMVALYRASAAANDEPLTSVLVEQTEAGKPVQVKLPIEALDLLSSGEGLILKVGDYAGHVVSYPMSSLDGNRLAMVSPVIELHGETFYAQVDAAMSTEILRQVRDEEANGILLSVLVASDVILPNLEIGIPCNLLQELNSQDVNYIRILTSLTNITIPKAAFPALADSQGNVWLSLNQTSDGVHLEFSSNGNPVDTLPGGIQLQVPRENCSATTVAAALMKDGTYKVIPTSVADSASGCVVVSAPGSVTVSFLDNSKPFADVPETEWYAEGVSFAAAHELVSGTGNNKFEPTANITRAAIATILYHLEWDQETGFENPFTDVEPGSWYETSVSWAAANNVVAGYGGGLFGPNSAITREQLAVILYNYARESGVDVTVEGGLDSFKDGNSVSSWAKPAMEWAVSVGLLHGMGNNTLLPGGTATRAQVAIVIMQYVRYLSGVSIDA